jgi:hypothetical protein
MIFSRITSYYLIRSLVSRRSLVRGSTFFAFMMTHRESCERSRDNPIAVIPYYIAASNSGIAAPSFVRTTSSLRIRGGSAGIPSPKDIQDKIITEKRVLEGAHKMHRLQHSSSGRQLVTQSIIESRNRLDYLESQLQTINFREEPVEEDDMFGNSLLMTAYILYNSNLTAQLVTYKKSRLEQRATLEKRLISGSEKLIGTLERDPLANQATLCSLKVQQSLSVQKEKHINKSIKRISQLNVPAEHLSVRTLELDNLSVSASRLSGMLKLKLTCANNMEERTAEMDLITATISVDGKLVYRSPGYPEYWDTYFEEYLDQAAHVEVCVMYKEVVLGMLWFSLSDLHMHLDKTYKDRPQVIDDFEDIIMNLCPSGRLIIKADFQKSAKAAHPSMAVFRKDAVAKVYPQNGHLFIAKDFTSSMKCTGS